MHDAFGEIDYIAKPLGEIASRVIPTKEALTPGPLVVSAAEGHTTAPGAARRRVRRSTKTSSSQSSGRKAKVSAAKGKAAKAAKENHGVVLVSDLDALYAQWRGSLSAHKLKQEARFLEVRRALKGEKGAAFRLDSGREAKRVAAALREARLKPKKGRMRDLRRVDRMLADLLGRVDD